MENRRTALVAFVVALAVAGCGGSGPDAPTLPSPLIHGLVMKSQGEPTYVGVSVYSQDPSGVNAAVADATVTINYLTRLAWNPARCGYDSPPFEPVPGEDLVLTVTIPAGSTVAAGTYSAVGRWRTAPTISAPASATTWRLGVDNVLTWEAGGPLTGTPAPSYYVEIWTPAGGYYPGTHPVDVATSSTSFTVPANALASGDYWLRVGIGTPGLYDGGGGAPFAGAASGSSFALVSFAAYALVKVE